MTLTGTLYAISTRKGRNFAVCELTYAVAYVRAMRILSRLDPDDDIREINWR